MNAERVQWVAANLALIGCLEARLADPLESAWERADRSQRGFLEAHIRDIRDLFPGLEAAYWGCLGRPLE